MHTNNTKATEGAEREGRSATLVVISFLKVDTDFRIKIRSLDLSSALFKWLSAFLFLIDLWTSGLRCYVTHGSHFVSKSKVIHDNCLGTDRESNNERWTAFL